MGALQESHTEADTTERQSLLQRQEFGDVQYADRKTMGWSTARKAAILGVVSWAVFNDALVSTIVFPALQQITDEFHVSSSVLKQLLLSVHVIGFALGPLIVSPGSELLGRNPLMHTSNFMMVLSMVIGALSNSMPLLLVSRTITGAAGCIPIVLEGGYIADLIHVEKRGKIIAVWTLAPLVGTVIGPIISGSITLRVGWRSVFWLMAILSGVQTVAGMLILTKGKFEPVASQSDQSQSQSAERLLSKGWGPFKAAFSRTARVAFQTPVVIITTLNMSMAFVYFYIIVTNLPTLFAESYGFDSAQIGFVYISPATGTVIGLAIIGILSDRVISQRRIARGVSLPEDRLFPLIASNVITAVGMLAYGWSVQAGLAWMCPLVAIAFTTIGISAIFVALQQYLTDHFGGSVSNAIAFIVVVRSILGVLLPLAVPSLYNNLGYGWGDSLLALVALAFCPTTFLLKKYGGEHHTP
ncbi:hypothetical protein N7509_000269 [Penicillium cosmopolitanum]|uniref:Major facilitator superfamily (MFS) profile domain-containing protein n=1 Tax=Penicillium cosmopolitanum TaxID=1131564 RepID=A0A9X0BDX7_9EURO|nr:uncharacterized protein N7509_000269 [Penicillium cosmopolitanum]KAJ5413642.1 hypothetical protein N7509_000269 [Penicillium cosmopolitanum]